MLAEIRGAAYILAFMSDTPAFLDGGRPPVPAIVVSRGVTPFFLPGRPVRGRLVRLGLLADALLSRHIHHPSVSVLTGQALALTAALSTGLKFQGSFSLQAKGDGPVKLLLADCTDAGELRGYAQTNPPVLERMLVKDSDPLLGALLGKGFLAFTVEPGAGGERHQGIVELKGISLAQMAAHYFDTSEQLRCHIQLACARGPDGWRAAALVMEKIAGAGGIDPAMSDSEQEEEWRTATILASTVTEAELLNDAVEPERFLYRLFYQEGVAVDRARALSFGCRCSRARLANILEGFSADDLNHMSVEGDIIMTCEFCNYGFRFPRAGVHGTDG